MIFLESLFLIEVSISESSEIPLVAQQPTLLGTIKY